MRTSAIAAILAVTIVPVSLYASDDFSALLADLSFGDAALHDSLMVAEEKTVAELKPVPTGIMMPGMIETAPEEVAGGEVAEAPQVALQDPIAATTTEASDQIDLEAAFALEGVQGAQSAIPARTVGHNHNRCHSQACDPVITCTPRSNVNLPSSTFMQYFRSNACNTNVWDGYQQKCRSCNKHIDGRCDCFNKGGKSCGRRGCAGGASCDAGCDG